MAKFNDVNTQQLQELVTCIICLDHYKDPRILPCSHTFCFKCIQQVVKDGKFNCPLRDDMTIDQNDIDKLPINRTAKDMVDFVLSIDLSIKKNHYNPCGNCDNKEALNWCEKCGTHYCESCTKSVHSIKALQSHTIVPSSDKTNLFCVEHSDEKFKYWCTQCDALVCRDCLLFKHKDHTFLALNDAVTEAKTKLGISSREINEIKRNLTQFSTTTNNTIDRKHKIVRQEKQDIEQIFVNLQRMLEERKCALIKELEDEEVQTMKILDRQKNIVDQQLNLTTVQELCIRKTMDSSDPIQVLKFQSTLSHNHKDFIEQYQKIDKDCIIIERMFKKDDRDVEYLTEKISKLGGINSKAHVVKKDGVTIKTIPLDISKSGYEIKYTQKNLNYGRGYLFSLTQPFVLRAIRIQSDYNGSHVGFVVNDNGIVIQNGTSNSTDAIMKWLIIPIECEIKNNYSILVDCRSGDGSYTFRDGNCQLRKINENCAVQSKYIAGMHHINTGSLVNILDNTYSIDMILDIDE